ncbi:MAG TPA: tyrosine--tRNA ligase, partial [Alphaproteobacteria bacterium]|nr:tyrosine--tRNA ligase [Alphaproteobacteria bacterium]
MQQVQSPFLYFLQERGFIHQSTDLKGLDDRLKQGMVTAYMGFDATGDSLHVGHLLGIMVLRHLQKFGHRPIILLGGGTTKIGDPSGKDESRKLLSEDDIQQNVARIQGIFGRFINIGQKDNQ